LLGALATTTERIGLGSGVFQIPARRPTAVATAAATLDRLSNGRMLLGLGLSGPQVSEGWYGVPFTAPLRRTEEYVAIIRAALSGEKVVHTGQEWTIPTTAGTGLGKPIRMLGSPVQDRIPIYLGVGGPKTVEQCGAIADGWLPFLFSPDHADELTEPLLRGIEKAGRQRSDVQVAPTVPAAVHEDLDTARDLVRPVVALYLGGMGPKDRNFYTELAVRYGHAASALACQELYLSGDRAGAEAALTPELIDTVALTATPDTVEKRLAAYERAGIDTLVVMPFGDRAELLRTLAAHR
jgi:F420-dependent oxidoreductase-like protein